MSPPTRWLLVTLCLCLPGVALAETSAQGPRICVQPLGTVDRVLLGKAVSGIKYFYGYRVRVLGPVAMPADAYYAPRRRYRAGKLLQFLEETVSDRDDCDIAVGFTKQDISTTNGKHKDWGIFGLGSVGGTTCVISTHRLTRKTKDPRKVAIRTIKVVNHELGHVLGLGHCPTKACMMEDAKGTIKTVDNETGLLCPLCRGQVTMFHGPLPERPTMDWDALVKED
jgi:archaemetzincin